MPKLSCLIFFLYVTLWCHSLQAQESTIESIQPQPAPEVYDLLKDSKGYLWLAHDLGVSRYDGSSFLNLSNPYQNSFAMTDLVEDQRGRIWCHNFTGQIFYIDKLKLHLLEQYKFEEEDGFPRIVICGNELISTSIKGLFVYNINTDQSKYYPIRGGTKSLTKVGNKVICYGKFGWYSYEAGQPIRKLTVDLKFDDFQGPMLQTASYKDTFYLINNPLSIYYKLTLDGSVIKVHAEQKTTAFLNTISVDGNNVWVHTKGNSFTLDGRNVIEGLSLSDIITDNTGHKWMSSLKKGLCIQYNIQQVKKIDVSTLSPGDYVRRMHEEGDRLFLTTANGKLYESNAQSSLSYILAIPKSAGIIEQITSIDTDQFFLAASIGLYLYNRKTQQLRQVEPSYNMKDIAVHKGKIYAASSIGVRSCSLEELANEKWPFNKGGLFNKENRCRSIDFAGDSLIIAYSDGLYIAYNNTIHRLLYNNHPIYASKVKVIAGKIIVGTYNQGLIIIESGKVRNLTEKDGLASNNIKDIRISAGRTWLVYHDDFQLLNKSLTGIENTAIYFPKIAGINDFTVLDNRLYVAANESVYSMKVDAATSSVSTATYIDKVLANGNDMTPGAKLKHFQNHLQFHVSTPFYATHSKIIYQYRITNTNDDTWQIGAPGQTVFNVVALEPGVYTFEIVATDKSRMIISTAAVYHFEITPPWQRTWTFRIGAIVVLMTISFYFIQEYYKNRLRNQRIEFEKQLAIQAERQRISSEIHDDIGAGLSAIRLLTEITKNKLPESEAQLEVSKIHASISELTQKMREVIWSLNIENDRLENLLYYLQRQAIKLFENSPIHLKVSFPKQEIPDIVINGEKRRHIYLSVKEALHNCLKHSDAHNCYLMMSIEGNSLQIVVTDDGKGFVLHEKAETGNGIRGMRKRMRQVNGSFVMQSKESTLVKFIVPLKEKA